MSKKTKYPNVYYDEVRNKYEFRKMVNGALLFGRADTPEEAFQMLLESKIRNSKDPKKEKEFVLPNINTSVDNYIKYKKNYIKATTLYKLRLTLNIYVKDRFRDVPVNQLNDDDFKMYYKYLKKTKLEISTKNKYLRNLKDIFDFINIMYGYDCIFVKRLLPFKDFSIDQEIKEIRVLSFDDIKKLYQSLESDYEQLLLLTLFLLGGRAGEILALNPTSFDLERNVIKIQYAATWKTDKKGFQLIQTKTPTSKRIYPMPEFYKQKYLEFIKKYEIPSKRKYIFFSKHNKKQPMCSSSLNRIVGSWSDTLGFRVYPHLFRHTTASLLNAYGVSVDVIQHLLGHSSSEITKQVYIHDTEEKKNAMNTLMNGFFKEMDSK